MIFDPKLAASLVHPRDPRGVRHQGTTMTDTKRLRELAEAQIPNESRGRWYARETYVYQSSDPRDRRQVCRVPTVCRPHEVDPTAAFIAAANPTAVIALLDDLRREQLDHITTLGQAAELERQLAAMTAARDELADTADRMIDLAECDDEGWQSNAYHVRSRISELRKVGL